MWAQLPRCYTAAEARVEVPGVAESLDTTGSACGEWLYVEVDPGQCRAAPQNAVSIETRARMPEGSPSSPMAFLLYLPALRQICRDAGKSALAARCVHKGQANTVTHLWRPQGARPRWRRPARPANQRLEGVDSTGTGGVGSAD